MENINIKNRETCQKTEIGNLLSLSYLQSHPPFLILKFISESFDTTKIFYTVISSLSISYTTGLMPPTLMSPEDVTVTSDTTPIFEWESVSGAASYLIQLDTSTSFDSDNIIE
ncbi:MAG: hypothetical protein ACFE68_09705 [Candidatus Hodarchaeota archaeon]